ncbi:hypothetical protein CK203_030132 [Vitis vinifera]|uniref:Uncharacterized protein n=1 Tax=Vitis vinifera TaxID=29760 RepID=A0A438I564_VITVI|nr:hypothetical protein CK203_030132 [Vitis vinifera]
MLSDLLHPIPSLGVDNIERLLSPVLRRFVYAYVYGPPCTAEGRASCDLLLEEFVVKKVILGFLHVRCYRKTLLSKSLEQCDGHLDCRLKKGGEKRNILSNGCGFFRWKVLVWSGFEDLRDFSQQGQGESVRNSLRKGPQHLFLGRSVVGGWQLLARKLRSLGFSLSQKGEESSNSSSRGRGLKGVSVGKEDPLVEAEFSGYAELRNVVWLEIEKGVIDSNKEEELGGEMGGLSDQPPNLNSLKSWAQSRVKWFKGKCLLLDWWNPSVGCLIEDRKSQEVWVRILGLPLHLWGMSFFKNLGETCDRFVGVDEDTVERQNLYPIVVGDTPWINEVQPSWCCKGRGGKDEGEVRSRALPRVAEVCSGKEDG